MSGIIRIEKNTNYTHISNVPANDKELSWEARGVLYYLLTKPDKWECRNRDLINKGPAGADKIERILDELQEHGYITRQRIKKEDGTFDWITTVYEMPIEPEPEVKARIALKKATAKQKAARRKARQLSTIPEKHPDGSTIGVKSTDGLHPHIVITEPEINKSKSVPKKQERAPAKLDGLKVIPAYKVYVEETKRNGLNKAQIAEIDKVVGHTPEALDRWRETVKAWNLEGNRLTNAAGMLDWFRTGKRSNYSPKPANGSPPTPSPVKRTLTPEQLKAYQKYEGMK